MSSSEERYLIIIPTLNPTDKLIALVTELRRRCSYPILLVNDGSIPECGFIFDRLSDIRHCEVIHHPRNMGKGCALKSAFRHSLAYYPSLKGAVTADDDGQHTAEDIVKCVDMMVRYPASLIIGARNFSHPDIPWKSRLGNKLTRYLFRFIVKKTLHDTQSGLRGIPAEFMKILVDKPGERFEFESIMLRECVNPRNLQIFPIVEYEITTVYFDSNRQTHFRMLVDSLKIYRVILGLIFHQLFLFTVSGLLSALLDQGLFALFYYQLSPRLDLPPLIWSVVVARTVSLFFNYTINRNVVFKRQKAFFDIASFYRYLGLCILVMFSSYGLLKLAHAMFPAVNMVVKKIIVDGILFLLSYQIQSRMIFKDSQ